MFFVYAAQEGVLSLIRKIRVASSWIVMDGRVLRRCRERWQAADDVWGPGSWGRTDLSPKSLGAPRRAGPDLQGLGRMNFQAPIATPRLMHSQAWAMPPPIWSKSAASSNGSTLQRATASSCPT